MDAIDYTPPDAKEREFLDWAMARHEAIRNAGGTAMTRQERNAQWIAYCLKLLREGERQ